MRLEYTIKAATFADVEAIATFYDEVNDALETDINYPGWRKGIYPARSTAEEGVEQKTLFLAMAEDRIAGSIILNHKDEVGYDTVPWLTAVDYSETYIIHTLAVHPDFKRLGVGRFLMDFAESYGLQNGKASIRLDVFHKNTPAITLYEQFGYTYLTTVDMGLKEYGLDYFKVYEKVL